jgi:hypothetical protein
MNEEAMRGTFGFVQFEWDKFEGEQRTRGAVVIHALTTGKVAGRLLVHYWGNNHFYAVISRDIFKPSRDAYFCEGSYVEPEWEGDSCRCTNYWSKHNYMTKDGEIVFENGKPVPIDANCATNILTDEEALKIYGPFVGERRIFSNVSLAEALTAVSDVPVSGSFDVLLVEHNKEFAGFKIVSAGQPGCI